MLALNLPRTTPLHEENKNGSSRRRTLFQVHSHVVRYKMHTSNATSCSPHDLQFLSHMMASFLRLKQLLRLLLLLLLPHQSAHIVHTPLDVLLVTACMARCLQESERHVRQLGQLQALSANPLVETLFAPSGASPDPPFPALLLYRCCCRTRSRAAFQSSKTSSASCTRPLRQ